jgi:hypothetical protein
MKWHPFWAGMVASAGAGWLAAGWAGPGLGWTAFGLSGVVCWVVHSWYRPLSDCWWCHGNPKRRGKRVTDTGVLFAGVAAVGGWAVFSSAVAALGAAVVVLGGLAASAGTGKSFHMCWKPVWIGGCRATGRRRRILTVITGRGFSRI